MTQPEGSASTIQGATHLWRQATIDTLQNKQTADRKAES